MHLQMIAVRELCELLCVRRWGKQVTMSDMLKSCVYIFMKLLLCHYCITPHFLQDQLFFKMIFRRISSFKILQHGCNPLYCGTVVMHS